MSDNWIVQNLNSALSTWNEKLAEIWTLLTQSPESFKGGTIWSVITGINGALTAIGYGLLVLFLLYKIFSYEFPLFHAKKAGYLPFYGNISCQLSYYFHFFIIINLSKEKLPR